MKKYLIISLIFLIAGLGDGGFYREFSKYYGMENHFSILGISHGHFLVLGVIMVLIIGLVNAYIQPRGKSSCVGLTLYVIGVAGAGIMMFIRGIMEMMILTGDVILSPELDLTISIISGICHIILTIGIILLFIAWIKNCKKEK